jgi:hypothetical protein
MINTTGLHIIYNGIHYISPRREPCVSYTVLEKARDRLLTFRVHMRLDIAPASRSAPRGTESDCGRRLHLNCDITPAGR